MDLFQGNMDAIIEYLHAQKATTVVNTTAVVVTNATVVTTIDVGTTFIVVETSVETMIQPIMNQSIPQPGPSRHVASYPWGMPLNYNPQFANGSDFVPYHPFFMPPTNGNFAAFPWGMLTHHSPRVVDADNHKIPQGLTRQNSVPVTTETLDDNEPEYIAPRLHFKIPP